MTAKPNPSSEDADMPSEIDFSQGVRGKFYQPDARFILPVHLNADVANELTRSAQSEGVDINAFVTQLLEEHRRAA